MPELSTPAALPLARRVPPWLAQIGRRFAYLQWLKLIGVSAFMWLFFVAYFHMLRHPAYPVTTMPLTAFDRWLPFSPQSLWVYISLWIYIGIAPGLMLRSSGQSEENFAAMHANNPLRRAVEAEDVIEAIRYLVGAKCVTGQLLVIDSGHRFMSLERDVQFLGEA